MRKLFVHISAFGLIFLLSSFSGAESGPRQENTVAGGSPINITDEKLVSVKASLLYELMDLQDLGLSRKAFEYAYKGYRLLLQKNKVSNPEYLTICDFSQSVRKKRLYIIDLVNNRVLMNTWVAHGKNSGGEFARRFSNRPSSLQSSLGFYVTRTIYRGEHGASLRIEGLEPGFNDRAYRRAIVVHGADYIGEGNKGRSFGCPAVPRQECNTIIQTIKNGSCFFIYHPDAKYLKGSKILNG